MRAQRWSAFYHCLCFFVFFSNPGGRSACVQTVCLVGIRFIACMCVCVCECISALRPPPVGRGDGWRLEALRPKWQISDKRRAIPGLLITGWQVGEGNTVAVSGETHTDTHTSSISCVFAQLHSSHLACKVTNSTAKSGPDGEPLLACRLHLWLISSHWFQELCLVEACDAKSKWSFNSGQSQSGVNLS